MSAGTTPTPTPQLCKIKRVYPRLPLHVHSAVLERLNGTALGNPTGELEISTAASPRLNAVPRRIGIGDEDTLGRFTSEA
jgi:hypothetical protein